MWRPKNWENSYAPADYPSGVVSAYEAGADAMLEALEENYIGKDFYYNANISKGRLVFIPEEEE